MPDYYRRLPPGSFLQLTAVRPDGKRAGFRPAIPTAGLLWLKDRLEEAMDREETLEVTARYCPPGVCPSGHDHAAEDRLIASAGETEGDPTELIRRRRELCGCALPTEVP